MSVLEELLALEERGAEQMVAGTAADFYDDILTDDVVLVVPGMVLDRATFLEGLRGEPETRATLPDGSSWTSMMNSTYVRRDGAWKLAYHQQTPDPD